MAPLSLIEKKIVFEIHWNGEKIVNKNSEKNFVFEIPWNGEKTEESADARANIIEMQI